RVKKDHGDFSQEEYNDFRKNLEDLFKYLTQEINRKDLFSSYEELVESINEAKIDVGKLIKHIIDKYEFGEKLKKYDV
ncbi:hypothetical protein KJ969_01715, partial [Patescibacteria group bacterium]|nr:hypothetical protein [Patescibacteria group bacterium]